MVLQREGDAGGSGGYGVRADRVNRPPCPPLVLFNALVHGDVDRPTRRPVIPKATPARAGGALAKPVVPSAEIAAVAGTDPLPRTEVVSKVWDHIRTRELQDSADKRTIVAADMRALIASVRDALPGLEASPVPETTSGRGRRGGRSGGSHAAEAEDRQHVRLSRCKDRKANARRRRRWRPQVSDPSVSPEEAALPSKVIAVHLLHHEILRLVGVQHPRRHDGIADHHGSTYPVIAVDGSVAAVIVGD